MMSECIPLLTILHTIKKMFMINREKQKIIDEEKRKELLFRQSNKQSLNSTLKAEEEKKGSPSRNSTSHQKWTSESENRSPSPNKSFKRTFKKIIKPEQVEDPEDIEARKLKNGRYWM